MTEVSTPTTPHISLTNDCSPTCCYDIQEKETNALQCLACKRYVHYLCTELPPYQLQTILDMKTKKYTCRNCVTIRKELVELTDTNDVKKDRLVMYRKDNQKFKRELERRNETISTQETTIKKLKKEIEMLKNHHLAKASNFEHIEKRLNDVFQKMETNLDSMQDQILRLPASTQERTFADVIKSNTNQPNALKSIFKEARNEEKTEERDKRSRINNVIIHGVKETATEDEEEATTADTQFVSQLFKDVGIETTTKDMRRLGHRAPLKRRPIKLLFNSGADKEKLMKNLKHLKGRHEYTGISVTNDLTTSERALYKSWKIKEELKNNEEPRDRDFDWKVRGTLKSGLFLKKVPHRDTHSQ